jgi:hypothetical protein
MSSTVNLRNAVFIEFFLALGACSAGGTGAHDDPGAPVAATTEAVTETATILPTDPTHLGGGAHDATATQAGARPFIREVTLDSGDVRIDVAISHYAPPDPAFPTITTVGMVHVAEDAFYDRAAEALSSQDVELYEAVWPSGFYGPPFLADPDFENDDARISMTTRRIRTVAKWAATFIQAHGRAPADWSELVAEPSIDPTVLSVGSTLSAAQLLDAWGHPLILSGPGQPSCDVISYGSDGVGGGTGSAADIRSSSLPPSTFDADQLLVSLRTTYGNLAETAQLTRQPARINFAARSSIHADISADLIFYDTNRPGASFGLAKYWVWRQDIPLTYLAQFQKAPSPPRHVAILYGAGHMSHFDQMLWFNGYTLTGQEWNTVCVASKATQSDQMYKARLSLVDRVTD